MIIATVLQTTSATKFAIFKNVNKLDICAISFLVIQIHTFVLSPITSAPLLVLKVLATTPVNYYLIMIKKIMIANKSITVKSPARQISVRGNVATPWRMNTRNTNVINSFVISNALFVIRNVSLKIISMINILRTKKIKNFIWK